MSEQAKEAVRKEVLDFYSGFDPYNTEDMTAAEIIDLFLERNHVVRIPEETELVVTEEPESHFRINGKLFAANPDPFYWQSGVEQSKRQIAAVERELGRSVELKSKREAVLAFLIEKQTKVTQYEAERQARRDKIARRHFEGNPYNALLGPSRELIDLLIEAQDDREASKS